MSWNKTTVKRLGLILATLLLAAVFVFVAVKLERPALRLVGGLAMAVAQRPARFAAAALALGVIGWLVIAALCAVESLRGQARS